MESSMYCWGGYSYTPLEVSSKDNKTLLMTKKKDAFGFIDGYSLRYDTRTQKWLWKKFIETTLVLKNKQKFCN